MKKGLGKGLSALFEEPRAEVKESSAEQEEHGQAREISINFIEPGKGQPRQDFPEEALKELAESIKIHGILQPLAVRETKNSRYEIIAGERRWRAAKLAGLKKVPVVIKNFDDKQAREAALVENLQREDLNPVEEALGLKGLIEEYDLTQEEAAARVGKSRPVVANALRLLALPPKSLAALREGKLSSGHARALLSLKDRDKIEDFSERIEKEGLSVRETEAFVRRENEGETEHKEPKKSAQKNIYILKLEEELSESVGRRVEIKHGAKKGRIEIEYYGNDDLETLIQKIKNM